MTTYTHINSTLDTGITYIIRDAPFRQTPAHFTGVFNGITDDIATFTTANDAQVRFSAPDLDTAIEHGEITIIEANQALTTQTNIRLPQSHADLLDTLTTTTGMTKTQVIIAALEHYGGIVQQRMENKRLHKIDS